MSGNNYIRWSEGFDNNAGNQQLSDTTRWSTSGDRSAISATKVANPLDGSITACQLVSPTTSTGVTVPILQDIQNKVITLGASNVYSVYAKAAGVNWVLLEQNSNPNQRQYFDLVNGVLGTPGAGVIAGLSMITPVGQGWYRCQMGTLKGPDNLSPGPGSNNHVVIRASTGDGITVLPTTAGQVLLQIYGAQLELTDHLRGGKASAYTRTTYQQQICRVNVSRT